MKKIKPEHSDKPDIYSYLDFRVFLNDCLPYIKRKNPGFRYQTLVEKYGLKSRSHFIDIVKGRKLTDRFIDNYCTICNLKGKEKRYFQALVRYNQTTSDTEKKRQFSIIIQLAKNLHTVKLENEAFEYFSQWYYPAMLSMLDLYPDEADYHKLAKMFKPRISAPQAKKALQILTGMGFVSWDKSKSEWIFHHKFLKCTDEARVQAIKEFHRQMQKLGSAAYENDFKDQTVSTLTVSVSENTREEIDRMIVECRKAILEKVKADANTEMVLQVNFQTFNLSKKEKKQVPRGRKR